MKKNKKGFTLIELLAVIVILGIILTIVVSNVVKYINDAREGSYVDAYQIIIKDLRTQLMSNEMENGTATLEECDDTNDTDKCANETVYKGMYDSKNINLRIEDNGSGAYIITATPTDTGSFESVNISSTSVSDAGQGTDKKTFSSTMETSEETSATASSDISPVTIATSD